MKAKDILIALDRAGMIKNCSIASGRQIKVVTDCIKEGLIYPQKTYLYSFQEISYIEHSAIIITLDNEKVYLYEI
nr:MAG TPA: hypothetical protein [Bacteriophage sp.]